MKIYYHTFKNHLVSDKEKNNLFEAFKAVDIETVETPDQADIIIVKAFSAPYSAFENFKQPIILQSYGVHWGSNVDAEEMNKGLLEFFKHIKGVVYMSDFARRLTEYYLEKFVPYPIKKFSDTVIFNSQPTLQTLQGNPIEKSFNCATTAIWRDWKRPQELIRLIQLWNQKIADNPAKPKVELFIGGNLGYKVDDPNIHYLGHVRDLNHYSMMHAYIHLALMETFGNTVAEAIAMGLPCLVTNFGAISELVENAGVTIDNEPEDYLNFKTRPVMYGKVLSVEDDKFLQGMDNLISNYDNHRRKAVKRAFQFSHKYIGKRWKKYLEQFI